MPSALEKLTPVSLRFARGQPQVTLCRLGPVAFAEPFFDQTVSRKLPDLEATDTVEVDLESSAADWETLPALEPAGFLFQMSRCGSTLVCQMLAAIPENLVISEARVINSLLSPGLSAEQSGRRPLWLRWVLRGLGQQLRGTEKRYFIKFTSWNVLQLDALRRAFPDVPWVFLHRDALEVLASVMKTPPGYMAPGMAAELSRHLQGDARALAMPTREELAARLLGSFCQAAVDHLASGGIAVDYQELPEAVGTRIAPHFGWMVAPHDALLMREASRFYSKDGTRARTFTADSREKRDSVAPALRTLAEVWVSPIRARLLSAGD